MDDGGNEDAAPAAVRRDLALAELASGEYRRTDRSSGTARFANGSGTSTSQLAHVHSSCGRSGLRTGNPIRRSVTSSPRGLVAGQGSAHKVPVTTRWLSP